MKSKWSRGFLKLALMWMLTFGMCFAQRTGPQIAPAAIATTQIQEPIYRADGTAASGTVLIRWPAFSTTSGASVPAGSISTTLSSGGVLSVNLVPNANSTPMGSYYTVVYHLDDGQVTREYWVVPVSASAVKVSAIRSSVLPATVALQTVSKSYVDTAITAATLGHPLDTTTIYVLKTGDTMSGPLVLPGDPTSPQQAADKNYVDTQVAGIGAGLSQKVSTLPLGSQSVVQPTGTQLQVNNLNGVEDATAYVSVAGNNGIANAAASPDCVGGCAIKAEQAYGANGGAEPNEQPQPATWANKTQLEDERGGMRKETHFNPLDVNNSGGNAGHTIDVVSTQTADQVKASTGATQQFSTGLAITSEGLTGGSNEFPQHVQGTVPYFKTTFSALSMAGTYNTPGQHVLTGWNQDCFGVGDCLMGGMFMRASGGFRDDADEGAHPFDLQFTEDLRVFTGQCAGGCSPGATVLQVNPTSSAGTQGEGRYLIDQAPAKVIRTGTVVSGDPTSARHAIANFAGTNFPLSVLLETNQTIPTQANSIKPGTVTIGILTSGTPQGYSNNTAALPTRTGVACVSDIQVGDGRAQNFETASYTVVDGSHLSLTLRRPHGSGATIAVGGLCGYGLEQTVDTTGASRQVFPVIASTSPAQLYYAGGQSALVGVQQLQSGFANLNFVLTSLTRTNGVVTATIAGFFQIDVNGLPLTISGAADPSYNGTYAVSTTTANTFTYVQQGADSTSSGGTASYLAGGYALYPMAEVLGVYNAQTHAVDGQFTLAANTVPWAAGDPVEEPHYFQQSVAPDLEQITQFAPRPSRNVSAGIQYGGVNGPGLQGWVINNQSPASLYFGNGGTHAVPYTGIDVVGIWRDAMEVEAGENSVLRVDCNSHGCDRWNSGYDLFQMQTSAGVDHETYNPANSTLTFNLRGTAYQFNPQAFTAGTINTTTLSAGTINGRFIGTVAPNSLPIFGPSGAAHAPGAVPDPGPATGTSRFLREDGVFAVPAGGSGGGGGSLNGAATITSGTVDNTLIGQTTTAAGYFSRIGAGQTNPNTIDFRAAIDVQTCSQCGIFLSNPDSDDTPNLIFRAKGQREVSMDALRGSYRFISENNGGGAGGYVMAQMDGSGTGPGAMTVFGPLFATNFKGILSGQTGVIGGQALTAGQCAAAMVTVAGAQPGTPVSVAALDGSLPSPLTMLSAAVTSVNNVTVQLCAVGNVTPPNESYNVRVIQ